MFVETITMEEHNRDMIHNSKIDNQSSFFLKVDLQIVKIIMIHSIESQINSKEFQKKTYLQNKSILI